jgi:hypothetical protein
MRNPLSVMGTPEKVSSYDKLDVYLEPFIRDNFSIDSQIFTMPACSGDQERERILDRILALEDTHGESKIVLHTFDFSYLKEDTGIGEYPERLWKHHVGDIFHTLLSGEFVEKPTFAWFDLTGPLTDGNLRNIQACITKLFSMNSFVAVTLAVHAVQGIQPTSKAALAYNMNCVNIDERVEMTSQLLIDEVGQKTKALTEKFVFSYRKKVTTFCVFGYMVTQPKQKMIDHIASQQDNQNPMEGLMMLEKAVEGMKSLRSKKEELLAEVAKIDEQLSKYTGLLGNMQSLMGLSVPVTTQNPVNERCSALEREILGAFVGMDPVNYHNVLLTKEELGEQGDISPQQITSWTYTTNKKKRLLEKIGNKYKLTAKGCRFIKEQDITASSDSFAATTTAQVQQLQ